MKAIGVRKATDRIRDMEELDVPVKPAGNTELLVEVHSVGLNPADYRTFTSLSTMGLELPFVGGYDFSGVVADMGAGVRGYHLGQAVYGKIPSGGAAAEYVTVDQKYIAPRPESLSHSQAAVIPIPIQTAYWFLVRKGHLQAGQSVLILGGGGGVGSVAIMLAKELGAKVAATGFAKHIPLMKAAGADIVIDVGKGEWDLLDEKVDLLLDTVGMSALPEAISHVRDGGTVLAMTLPAMPDPPITDNRTLHWVLFSGAKPDGEVLLLANRLVEKGVYKPSFEREVDFSAAGMIDGLSSIWEHRKKGRIVMKVKP